MEQAAYFAKAPVGIDQLAVVYIRLRVKLVDCATPNHLVATPVGSQRLKTVREAGRIVLESSFSHR